MLFGLEKSIGKSAIFVQAIPFVLLHLGKPFLETLACIPGALFLVTWHTEQGRFCLVSSYILAST
jgi:membrane protease YdiL (CAAX protease family)